MRKIICILCICCLIATLGTVPAGAINTGGGTYSESIFNVWQKTFITATKSVVLSKPSCDTLGNAVAAAENGFFIGLVPATHQTAAPVTVSKQVTLSTDYNPITASHAGSIGRIVYTGTGKSFLTVTAGGELTLTSLTLEGNTNSTVHKGGLVYVKSGGTLVLYADHYTNGDKTVTLLPTFRGSKLTASDSKGGAIYIENGGKLILNGVTLDGSAFIDNSAKTQKDYYLESGAVVISDLNGDYTIDIRDLIRQKKSLSGAASVTNTADCNHDGTINAADIVLFKSHLLGK